ncbi:MAG: hypothetical protein J6M53_07395 [Bacteroidaceae bacterium]|nr:hypothetical protein [Bacteroidaceae bacterium]
MAETEPLIDNGTFEGGYVKEEDGFVSYWLGVVTIYGSSSSNSNKEEYYDFNSYFYGSEFWTNLLNKSGSSSAYYGSSMTDGYAGSSGFTFPHLDDIEKATNDIYDDKRYRPFSELAFVFVVQDALLLSAARIRNY